MRYGVHSLNAQTAPTSAVADSATFGILARLSGETMASMLSHVGKAAGITAGLSHRILGWWSLGAPLVECYKHPTLHPCPQSVG